MEAPLVTWTSPPVTEESSVSFPHSSNMSERKGSPEHCRKLARGNRAPFPKAGATGQIRVVWRQGDSGLDVRLKFQCRLNQIFNIREWILVTSGDSKGP